MKQLILLLSWIIFLVISVCVLALVLFEFFTERPIDGIGIFISIFFAILSLTFFLKWKIAIGETQRASQNQIEEQKDSELSHNSREVRKLV